MVEQKVPSRRRSGYKNRAVSLLTAHKAKGREFSSVFIIRAVDGKWGNNVVRELIKLPAEIISNTDLSVKEKNEDERRLFYVALTRAKNGSLSLPQLLVLQSREKENIETMFLSEIRKSFR